MNVTLETSTIKVLKEMKNGDMLAAEFELNGVAIQTLSKSTFIGIGTSDFSRVVEHFLMGMQRTLTTLGVAHTTKIKVIQSP